METQSSKRRRVYSLEPSKVVQSLFARNYLNYLVPALMKIKAKSATSVEDSCRNCDVKKNVKYEVDMAMVFSAQGFAWSEGLKLKLQKDHHVNENVAAANTSFLKSESSTEEGSSRICDQNEIVPVDFCANSSSISKSQSKSEMPELEKGLGREDIEDEEEQLKSLRKLVPGGEDICDEEMVGELESYVRCLQMQVNVLQCLVAETS